MIGSVPAEVEFGWIYFPPTFFAIVFGVVAASIAGKVLNKTGYSRFFWNPPLTWLAFVVIAASLFGLFVLPP